WNDGDVITLDLPMPVVGMEADPRAEEFRGKTAVMRGPLLYCFEGIDNMATSVRDLAVEPGEAIRPFVSDSEPQALYQPAATLAAFVPVDQPDLLGGVTVLQGPAAGRDAGTELTAVPFYAWSNREPTPMAVWIDWADGEGRQGR
ncbi:MAG: glycoside hydrolase family 127 protein, partial [Chloroflexi bacterium]|nr:glycoside hydrolase family 127 protein [Chloroflexota bacterium]